MPLGQMPCAILQAERTEGPGQRITAASST
jgi:hypothetical protein